MSDTDHKGMHKEANWVCFAVLEDFQSVWINCGHLFFEFIEYVSWIYHEIRDWNGTLIHHCK